MSTEPSFTPQSNAPVFILSHERSGSTLLRWIVDSHSQVCSPAQVYLGRLCEHLHTAVHYTLGQSGNFADEAARAAFVRGEVRRVVDEIMGRYAAEKGKTLWCDKSTLNLDHLERLAEIFPDARFLCLYRNCMDVAQSCLKFNALGFMDELAPYVARHPTNLVTAMAASWLDKSGRMLRFETAHAGACHRIRYEDLVARPKEILPAVFTFLGLEWEPELIERVFTQEHDAGDGDIKLRFSRRISADSIGKGRSLPDTVLRGELREKVDQLHGLLGYPSLDAYYGQPPAAAEAAAPREEAGDFDLCAFMAAAKARLADLPGTCRLVVQGAGGGRWTFPKEAAEATPDCTVALAGVVLAQIMAGLKSPVDAYEAGEVAASGDLDLALEFALRLFDVEVAAA